MNAQVDPELMELDVTDQVDTATLLAISSAEINQQIATARNYPRSIKTFMDEVQALVTYNESVAQSCMYAVPRDGKTVVGPSARFAEVLAHCWGNNLSGGRVVADDGEFLTSQGAFHDLQKNAKVVIEVRRRVTDRNGRRYSADMVMTTGNAGVSIAHRNATLKGIPKALWWPLYEEARACALGDTATLSDRRAKALAFFGGHGITPERIYAKLEVKGLEDIGLPQLEILLGLSTAVREDSTKAEELFAPVVAESTVRAATSAGAVAGMAEKLAKKAEPKADAE